MKIVACLAWFDEPAEFLDRCVRSLAGVADTLVAIDGPWYGFPHGECSSATEQAAAIIEAARAAGLNLDVQDDGLPWPSQVAKRDYLMCEASDHGEWLFVIDADEHVTAADRDLIRQELAGTNLDVATVICRNVAEGHANDSQGPIRRFYRAPVTVEKAHNGYRTADGRWLHGHPGEVTLEQTLHVPLVLEHRPRSRGEDRNRAAAAYRATRRAELLEAWR